jgi:hypothetical protein
MGGSEKPSALARGLYVAHVPIDRRHDDGQATPAGVADLLDPMIGSLDVENVYQVPPDEICFGLRADVYGDPQTLKMFLRADHLRGVATPEGEDIRTILKEHAHR